MEEKQLTPEEVFFKAKSDLERAVTEAVKQFAGTYATDVNIEVGVTVLPHVSDGGEVLECRVNGVTINSKYSQSV